MGRVAVKVLAGVALLSFWADHCGAHDLRGLVVEQSSASPSLQKAIEQTPTSNLARRSVLSNLRLWPVPHNISICFHGGDSALRKRVAQSMRRSWDLETLTDGRLNFDKVTFASIPDCGQAPSADIRVSFTPKDGYWSYVGNRCAASQSEHELAELHRHRAGGRRIRSPRGARDRARAWPRTRASETRSKMQLGL